jgi:hypothetical protein
MARNGKCPRGLLYEMQGVMSRSWDLIEWQGSLRDRKGQRKSYCFKNFRDTVLRYHINFEATRQSGSAIAKAMIYSPKCGPPSNGI